MPGVMQPPTVDDPEGNGLSRDRETHEGPGAASYGSTKLNSTTYMTAPRVEPVNADVSSDHPGKQKLGGVTQPPLTAIPTQASPKQEHGLLSSIQTAVAMRTPPPPPALHNRSNTSPKAPAQSLAKLYGFIPTEHSIEQPDEADDEGSHLYELGREQEFQLHGQSVDSTTGSLEVAKGSAVAGMDGPIIRGRCIDEITYFGETPVGLPPVPEAVRNFGAGVQVVCRVRPQTALELAEGGEQVLQFEEDNATVSIGGSGGLTRECSYTLHKILDPNATQDEAYREVAHGVIEGALYGYNGTILAYGQTGSGKTYTTFGAYGIAGPEFTHPGDSADIWSQYEAAKGVIPRSIETIFGALRTLPADVRVEVNVSMVEIYQDRIRDLLVSRAVGGGAVQSSLPHALVASSAVAATTVALPVVGIANAAQPHPQFITSPAAINLAASISRSQSPRRFDESSNAARSTSPRAGRSGSPRASSVVLPMSPTFAPMRSPVAVNQSRMYGEDDPDNLNIVYDATFGSQITGATSLAVKSERQLMDILRIGSANRVVAATGMNEASSRSHCIVVLSILQDSTYGIRRDDDTDTTAMGTPDAETVRYSKLYFVDLAGSERTAKSKVSGVQMQEAQAINSSLSTLGSVINALANATSHVPYRNNKLTRLLQDGLGNNSRTALVINVSPSSYNVEETKSSLRFGASAVRIRTKSTSNMLNQHDVARKHALNKLQRAKSYSSFLRDNQRAEAATKARERAQRQQLMKQKMKQLGLTNPQDAITTPAPSNVVIPDVSPRARSPTQSFFSGDGDQRPSGSPEGLKKLLRHPSAHLLLGSAAHTYLAALAQEIDEQEKAAIEAVAIHEAIHHDRDGMYDHPEAGNIALSEIYDLDKPVMHNNRGLAQEELSPTGDTGSNDCWPSDALPTIVDDEEETEVTNVRTFRSSSSFDGKVDGLLLRSHSDSQIKRRRSQSPLRAARKSGTQLPSNKVLAPCEVYSITLTQAPLGFRFFEAQTATHVMPLLPPLTRVKSAASAPMSPLSLGSAHIKVINPDAVLPVVENVLPGYPADFLMADDTNAIAFPSRTMSNDEDSSTDESSPRTSDDRQRGWESRGALAIGDRLLAVNGIRLDLLPTNPDIAPCLTPSVMEARDDQLSQRYAEATNRAVKLVKYAMAAMKRTTSSLQLTQTQNNEETMMLTSSSAESGTTSALSTQSADNGTAAGSCTLTFISAGPFVRRGIIVGLRLALHHEAQLKKLHDSMVETQQLSTVQTERNAVKAASPERMRKGDSTAVAKASGPVSPGLAQNGSASPRLQTIPASTPLHGAPAAAIPLAVAELPVQRVKNTQAQIAPIVAGSGDAWWSCMSCTSQ